MKNEVTITRKDFMHKSSEACSMITKDSVDKNPKMGVAEMLTNGIISATATRKLFPPESTTDDSVITLTPDELTETFAEVAAEHMTKAEEVKASSAALLFMLNGMLIASKLRELLFGEDNEEEEEEQKHPEEALAEAINKSAGESNDSQH